MAFTTFWVIPKICYNILLANIPGKSRAVPSSGSAISADPDEETAQLLPGEDDRPSQPIFSQVTAENRFSRGFLISVTVAENQFLGKFQALRF
eukprot:jgi/Botrbrau1/20532/Bobra.145_2s0081.1